MTREREPLMYARGISRHFGGVKAVDEVSLTIAEGRFHCIIGSNGAGKTTLFDMLAGAQKPSSGTIEYLGRRITRWSSDRRARNGIVRTFQQPRAIDELSVRENVALASAAVSQRYSISRLALGRDADWDAVDEALATCSIDRPEEAPTNLSHGLRKRLELATALVAHPKILLLDEPTAGMTVEETEQMAALLTRLAARYCLVVIEHDLGFVRRTADFVTVMNRGRVLTEGTPEQIEANTEVRDIYLGVPK